MALKVASYFSGIGGLDLGLDRAGFDIVSLCEKDEYRREVLFEHFGNRKIFTDISEVYYGESEGRSSSSRFLPTTQVGRKAWAGLRGSIDLLCGGFPCQDLSVAGKRAGLAGERSGLFYEFARIADESIREGGYVLIENVPGLFSANEGKDFEILLQTLYELGFNDIAWRVFDSQYFGVPQKRRRVFILGKRSRGTSCAKILLEPESGIGDYEAGSKEREKNTPISISGLGDGGPDDNDAQAGRLIPALTTRAGNTQDDQQTMQLISTLQAHKNGYRLDADSVGQFVPERTGVRRLTPIECERLQGFPDNWTLVNNASDTKRYAAIGDAVTVPVAEWIGRRILSV